MASRSAPPSAGRRCRSWPSSPALTSSIVASPATIDGRESLSSHSLALTCRRATGAAGVAAGAAGAGAPGSGPRGARTGAGAGAGGGAGAGAGAETFGLAFTLTLTHTRRRLDFLVALIQWHLTTGRA